MKDIWMISSSINYSKYEQKPNEYGKKEYIFNECRKEFEYGISNFVCKSSNYNICDSCYEIKKD